MKGYTDIEQSKKLVEILPIESADMFYKAGNDTQPTFGLLSYGHIISNDDIPCWSLASLLSALKIYTTPTAFSTNMSVPSLTKTKNGYSITYVGDYRIMESNNNNIESPIEIVADNPVDACVAMIEKLHELKML